MSKHVPTIDLADVYDESFTHEVQTYRRFVTVFIDQIFIRHYVETGLIQKHPYNELVDLDFHSSLTAYHFTRKILEYYLDRKDIRINEKGHIDIINPIEDQDPEDEELDRYLSDHPEKHHFFSILRKIRDVAKEVLFEGQDALLTLANDNFRQAMQLWEDLMLNAQVKRPCHQLVLRAMQDKARQDQPLTIFEGGAGVGSILRDGLKDPRFINVMEKIGRYHFTDVSLSLIKMGRESLRKHLPQEIFDRFEFKVANLDKLFLNGTPFTRKDSVDMIILEHVLYDVIDLGATLELFRKILKPGGYLVFTMAFRTAPKHFFPFEYLQSTFQSYNKAKLEEGYRNHVGYLTLTEWENSLKRAGFENIEVHPAEKDQVQWPYGGILAVPSK
jgi:SAM-dependent methyltransferase